MLEIGPNLKEVLDGLIAFAALAAIVYCWRR